MPESQRSLLVISPSAHPRGGVETVINNLCTGLPRRGWRTVLGLTHGRYFHDIDAYERANPNLPVVRIVASRPTRRARIAAIIDTIHRIRPDVVLVARIGEAYEAVAAIKQSNCYKPRLALAIRGLEAQYFFDARYYSAVTDGCFADGELIRQISISFCGLENERVFNLPSGIAPPVVDRPPRPHGGPLRIGYVGRIAQSDKRILDLVLLMRQLRSSGADVTLDIAGAGPDEQRLRKQLSEAGCTVREHGWVDHATLYRAIYPRLDCVVNFSATEGLTIAPREALANGVVPVLSRFPGLETERIFVEGQNALMFPVGDVQEAARKVLMLAQNSHLLERLSRNAMSSQSPNHFLEGALDAWAEALNHLLKLPLKTDGGQLRRLKPEGRLEGIGTPACIAESLRAWLGREPKPLDAGAEWPHGMVSVPECGMAEIMHTANSIESGQIGLRPRGL